MSATYPTSIEKELMIRNQKHLLLGLLVMGAVWQLARILSDLNPSTGGFFLTAIGIFGWIGWSIFLVRLVLFQKSIKRNPILATALNDELFQQRRLKAFELSFWAVVISQCLIIISSMVYSLPAKTAADVTIFIATSSLISSLLLLDRD